MPYKDGTGPDGNGPKTDGQGTPTPRRERRKDGSGGGLGKWGNQGNKRGDGQNQSPGFPGGRNRNK